MIEFYIYLAVTYLFTAGFIIRIKVDNKASLSIIAMLIVYFIFSPILMPFKLGLRFGSIVK